MAKKKDPKVGTGKKPKGSGRRLYTDENPKDTVSIKYATPADARKTVAKVKKIKKVAKALKKASDLHKKQSKVIEKHIKEMKSYGRSKKGNR